MKLLPKPSHARTRSSASRTTLFQSEPLERRVLFNQVLVTLQPGSSLTFVSSAQVDRVRAPNFAALVTLTGTNIQDTTPHPNQHVITGTTTSIDSFNITSGTGAVNLLVDGKGLVQMGALTSAVPLNAVSLKPTTFVGTFTAPVTKLDLGQANGATIHATTTGKPVLFTAGTLTDTKLTFDNSLRMFQSGAYTESANHTSTFRAPFVNLMKINGNFSCDMTLTGGASLVLGKAMIAGSMTNGFVSVTGNAGTFGGPQFTMTRGRLSVSGSIGGVSAATFGPESRVTATGQLGTLKSAGNFGGTYQFASLKSFTVGGNVDSASVQLNLPYSPTSFDLTTATVHGNMTNSSIMSAGNMKRLSFAQVSGSTIWAGINPATPTTGATPPSAIVNPARIDSFLTHAFAATDLAGGRLGSLNLGAINPDNAGTSFGITAQFMQTVLGELGTKKLTLKNVVNTATAQQQLQKLGITAQDLRDFMILLSQ